MDENTQNKNTPHRCQCRHLQGGTSKQGGYNIDCIMCSTSIVICKNLGRLMQLILKKYNLCLTFVYRAPFTYKRFYDLAKGSKIVCILGVDMEISLQPPAHRHLPVFLVKKFSLPIFWQLSRGEFCVANFILLANGKSQGNFFLSKMWL